MSNKITSARICGVSIPISKPLYVGLSYIFGIGRSLGMAICFAVKIDPRMRVYDMTEEQLSLIRKYIQDNKILTEGDLHRVVQQNIKLKISINCYEGYRHRLSLPLRKNTKTNARTKKGPRGGSKVVANKKK